MTAKFISIEGSEGAGKTTAITYIRELIEAHGHQVIVTREPGGTPFAEKLRALLLTPTDENIDPIAELLLMFAGRKQHVESVIKPALANGNWVISDRFTDATYAYQGAARGLTFDIIDQYNQLVLDCFAPDLTLLFDLPVAVGMQRAQKRADLDRFEQEKLSFFEKVRQGYLARAKTEPQRIKIVDAEQSIVQVQTQLKHLVQGWL